MALRKAVVAAKPVAKRVVNPVILMKSLLGKDVTGKVFQVMPKQTKDVTQLPWFGKIANPEGTFMVENLSEVNYTFGNKLYMFKGVDEKTGVRSSYVHPDLRIKEIKKKTAALESVLFINNAQTTAREMFATVNKYNLGADPEVFAVDAKGNMIPAFNFLGDKTKGRVAYWDGYQAEFIVDINCCMAYMVDSIAARLRHVQQELSKKYPGARLTTKNTFDVSLDQLAKDDPKYVNFGCTPSLNVYGEEPITVEGKNVPFRSAGGHMHFTHNNKNSIPACIKELDRVLGVISVAMFQKYDDPRRRIFYGKAGEYRTPSYGFEYRVLSNAWMVSPATTHFVFELARRCIANANASRKTPHWDVTEAEARQCINTCDVGMAQMLLKRNEKGLMGLLAAMPGISATFSVDMMQKWRSIIFDGVDKFLTNPDSFSTAWGFNDGWVGHSEGKCGNLIHTCNYLKTNNKIDW